VVLGEPEGVPPPVPGCTRGPPGAEREVARGPEVGQQVGLVLVVLGEPEGVPLLYLGVPGAHLVLRERSRVALR